MNLFNVKSNSKKGFTLIELLVVIAIIGLLATLSIVALNSARMRARDVRRKADLKQIYNALQMYYDENGKYPPAGTCAYGSSCFIYSIAGKDWFSVLSPWMSTQPLDPTNNLASPWADGHYSYTYGNVTADGQGFDLLGQLENNSDPDRCEIKKYKFKGSIYNPSVSWCPTYSKYIYSPQ